MGSRHTRRVSDRLTAVARLASQQHGAVSARDLDRLGVGVKLRSQWVQAGRLERAGPRAYFVAGSAPMWRRGLWAAAANAEGLGVLAGRSAARLHGLDGFGGDRTPELLLRREHRGVRLPYVMRFTSGDLGLLQRIDGIACQSAEALILNAPRFGFTVAELENAIDSAIRLHKLPEERLRQRVLEPAGSGVDMSALREAMVDTGGESRLERRFLAIVRRGTLPRPEMRVICRAGGGFAARLDARFIGPGLAGDLVVELEGHATHSSRQQRRHDEARRTTLTLQGFRVIVFTYLHIRDESDWVLAQLQVALTSRWHRSCRSPDTEVSPHTSPLGRRR